MTEQAAHQAVGEVRPMNPFGTGLQALVVDDDATTAELCGRVLREAGCATQIVAIGAARGLLVAGADLLMVNDGPLAREVLASGLDAAVILLSDRATVDAAVEALRLGAADFVVKPVRAEKLAARLERVVGQLRRRRDEHRAIVELKSKNRELERLVVRDPLTGLFNHAFFREALAREIAASRRNQREFALVFVDVDGFKQVNDSLGHLAGDKVLGSLAALLGSVGHASTGFSLRGEDVAARYGGDEFVILLPNTSKTGAASKAQQLRAVFEKLAPVGVRPQTLSAGVAAYPEDGVTPEALVHAADVALYAAKALGRNRVVAFSSGMAGLKVGRPAPALHQMAGLERAIAARRFRFEYQPIVHADSGEIVAYEGLCRPQDDVFADVRELLATAERAGAMGPLGRILRELVVEPMGALDESRLLFVNLHPFELYDPALLEVEPFLRPWAERIVFEVLEGGAARDYARMARTVSTLRAHGFRIALDDVAGWTGLAALAEIAPDFVKLCVGRLARQQDGRGRKLVRHIVDFAKSDGLQVIALGVESEAEREEAAELGCPLAQGFYYARPAPAFAALS